jgi:AcrR family transcriptional regulator
MPEKASAKRPSRASARERLLAAASELFYAEGVTSVGIDRVIEKAGVAKATLYNAFGSKDELVRAYLQARHAATRERMTRELAARYATPAERLVGVFEVQGLSFTDPAFRGCAFVSASAEARPGGAVEEESGTYRTWVHELFHDLAVEAGAKDRRRSPSNSSCSTTAPVSGRGWTGTRARRTRRKPWPPRWCGRPRHPEAAGARTDAARAVTTWCRRRPAVRRPRRGRSRRGPSRRRRGAERRRPRASCRRRDGWSRPSQAVRRLYGHADRIRQCRFRGM